jgi:hypothetical protein
MSYISNPVKNFYILFVQSKTYNSILASVTTESR